jgi:hypothetical protein
MRLRGHEASCGLSPTLPAFIIPSLQENLRLLCVKFFAVRFISDARQRDCLPCVFYRAHDKEKTHGKQALCRALEKTHDKDLVCRAFYFLARSKEFSPTGR